MPKDERDPTPLPISLLSDKTRNRLIFLYANKVWRHTDVQKIATILENLYEEAYSNGLAAMDKMHALIDNKKKEV
jgi:hypothetical protein